MLEPRSIAIIGVSEKLNAGHIILNNILREGRDHGHVHVIKPGSSEIEGCRCYPDVASLPEKVDLFILCVDAAQVAGLVDDVCRTDKAQALIVIPGGLGEKAGTEVYAERIRATLQASRATPSRGPILNGGNCLGIRSRPGRYDTLFIPEYKLPPATCPERPLALISQSGAFAICILSKLGHFNPRYLISVGNQVDLTVGDYLSHLEGDRDTTLFACYVEGFLAGDRERFLKAARSIVKGGRRVLLYLAGRTKAGKAATRAHTASEAQDYDETCALARRAGVIVAESIAEFEDLCRIHATLDHRTRGIRRIAAISNAGFECVATADNLGSLELAKFSPRTSDRLLALFKSYRAENIVGVQNPLDLTPMANDATFAEAVKICLEDDSVDAAIIGCVPLTGMMSTLTVSPHHREDVSRAEALPALLSTIASSTHKPMLVAVDSGHAYNPLTALFDSYGIPAFRTVDQATRALALATGSAD